MNVSVLARVLFVCSQIESIQDISDFALERSLLNQQVCAFLVPFYLSESDSARFEAIFFDPSSHWSSFSGYLLGDQFLLGIHFLGGFFCDSFRTRHALQLNIIVAESSQMSYQTTESKKEEFRKYLQKTGVIDHLTRALVGLYEETDKPNNSIEYLKKNLGAPIQVDTVKLKAEMEKVKDENIRLRKQLQQYRKELENLKQEDGQD